MQHRLAPRGSTTLLPFPLSQSPPSRDLVVHGCAREKRVSPEVFHDGARRFESDATRLSLPRGTVCCALNNAVAQHCLQLFARTSTKCALALADIAASTYLGKDSVAIIFAQRENRLPRLWTAQKEAIRSPTSSECGSFRKRPTCEGPHLRCP